MPPGLSRENVKKRKASSSEGSDELGSGQEEQPPAESNIAASRQPRASALKSHKVWDVLKPGAKVHEGETDLSEAQQPSAPKVGRPRKTPILLPASLTSPVEESAKMEIGSSAELAKEHDEEQPQIQRGSQRIVLNRKVAAASLAATNSWPQPQPAKDRGQLQLIEKEVDQHQQFADDPMTNTEEPSDEEDDEDKMSPRQDDRVLLDDPNDEDYPEFPPTNRGRRGRGGGDMPSQRGRGRGSRGGSVAASQSVRGTTSTRGRPRGSRMPMGGGVMGGRVNFPLGTGRGGRMQMGYYPPPRATFGPNGTSPIYSIQPSGGIVGDLPLRPPSVRIVRARPAGELAAHQQNVSGGFRSLSVRAPPSIQYGEESFKINRELENYRDSIVHGTSVQQFNGIIDQLLNELSRAADDREKLIASHREYVDHLQLTHSAAQEIKDKRIKQLEQSLEQTQQKLMLAFKHEQLHLVKNSVEGSSQERGGGDLDRQQSAVHHQQQLGQDGGVGAGDSSGGASVGRGATLGGQPSSTNLLSMPSQMENLRPAGTTVVRHLYPVVGQQQNQRLRSAAEASGSTTEGGEGTAGQLQQHAQFGINSPYEDDYDDDELEDDEEEFEYDDGDSADIDDDLGAQVTI